MRAAQELQRSLEEVEIQKAEIIQAGSELEKQLCKGTIL